MNIEEHLCEFIKSNLVGEGVPVAGDTPFEKLGLDSFSIIEIILFIERKYGITIPDKELSKENLFSAASLAKCVQRNLTPDS
jgi:acyl carrier protein